MKDWVLQWLKTLETVDVTSYRCHKMPFNPIGQESIDRGALFVSRKFPTSAFSFKTRESYTEIEAFEPSQGNPAHRL